MGRQAKPPPHDAPAVVDWLVFERQAAAAGFVRVAGIDEVGRGPLAGPVVAAAVILPDHMHVPAVNDSKKLTNDERTALAATLRAWSRIAIGIGVVPVAEIDRLNILRATHMAMRLAVLQLQPPPDFVLIDGLPVPGFPIPSKAVVKGDALSASIAAASILAKVYRDRLMEELDREFPVYGWAQNKGYGTPEHLAALRRHGPCALHRRSFAPVREALGLAPRQPELDLVRPD